MKPDIEYFFGKPMKVYCGKCERIMFTATTKASVEMFFRDVDRCPWCKEKIDGGDGGAEGGRVHADQEHL